MQPERIYKQKKTMSQHAPRGNSSPQGTRGAGAFTDAYQRVKNAPIHLMSPADIEILQRTIGNRAVGGLLQAKMDAQNTVQRQEDAPCPSCPDKEEEIEPTLQRQAVLEAKAEIQTKPVGDAFSIQRSCGTQADCIPDDEGYPLIYRSAGGGKTVRSCRAAVGYAQTQLNEFFASGMLQECINLHIRLAEDQGAPLPEEHRRAALITDGASKAPLTLDCWFGTNTTDVTEAFQAAVFEDPVEWDGKIGPKTWDAIMRFEAAPTVLDCPFRRSDGSIPTTPAPTPTPTPPAGTPICGPDVTTEVQDAVANTRTAFAGWSAADKEAHCDALDSLSTGAYAWDIIELHNNAWIHTGYRPACATAGATPPCGSTVEIDNECSYAGSPNYVIYGAMCKLCHDHYVALGNTSGRDRFTHAQMQIWINRYKGTGWLGIGTPSANFVPSTQWATAGYNGWPGTSSPAGDRNTCVAACPTPYAGPGFTVAWWRLRPRRRTVI